MLKMVGAILILSAGTLLGFYKSAQYANRPKHIRQMIRALQVLETEIMYGVTVLSEAFEKISRQLPLPLSAIFSQAALELTSKQGQSTMDAWDKAVTEQWDKTAMKSNEKEIFRQLGFSLGISDREDQIKHLHLAVRQLQGEEETAREDQQRYEKMCKSLGVLAGALIVVLMY